MFGRKKMDDYQSPYGNYINPMAGYSMTQAMPQAMPQGAPQGGLFGKKKGLGGFLGAFAGNLGDSLTGQPTYAQSQMLEEQQRRAQEAAAAQQAAMMEAGRGVGLNDAQIRAQMAGIKMPEGPAIQQNAEYIRSQIGEQAAQEYLKNYGQQQEEPRMMSLPDGRTVFGTMDEIMQVLGGGRQPQRQQSVPRPQGKTDDMLFQEAREAVEKGASVDAVFRQLKEWGVKI